MEHPTMMGYIKDQPRALRAAYEEREVFVRPFVDILKNHNIKSVYILGSGTSYHAGLVIARYLETYLRVEAECMYPTAFTHYEPVNRSGLRRPDEILCLAISQSGTSVSTIGAVRRAKELGLVTAALTEALDSAITKEADTVIHLPCGKELIPPETRGYTYTLLAGLLWGVEAAHALGQMEEGAYRAAMKKIEADIEQMESVVAESVAWYDKNREELLGMTLGAITGYGINHPTAMEAVLKLGETFGKPVVPYEMEEYIHGPNMATTDKDYIYFIAGDEAELGRVPLFQEFFGEITPHVFTIACAGSLDVRPKGLKLSISPSREFSPIALVVPFQILAARLCEDVGRDTSKRPGGRRSFAHL